MTPAEIAMLRDEAAYYRRQERNLTALGKHGEARRNRSEAVAVEARITAAEAAEADKRARIEAQVAPADVEQEGYCRYGICEPGEKHASWCTKYAAAEIAGAQQEAQAS